MPNIRETNVGALDIRPTEVGVEATAAAARRGGAFFNQASGAMDALGHRIGSTISAAGEVAVKYIDHQEISRGAAVAAKLMEEKDREWNQIPKDPNDPTHAAKWREESLEPTLEQFKQGFTTEKSQQYAEHFVEQYRTHMFHKTTADMSSLAADATHINVLKTANSLGNTLVSDPSGLDFARDALKSSLDGIVDSSPNLTAAQASKVRSELLFKGEEHLVKSAVTGAILKGGDWQKLANDPKNAPFINASEMIQFERAAKAQQRSEELTAKQLERYGHQQLVLQAEQGLGKTWNDNVSFDDNGHPTIKPQLFQQIMDVNRQTEGVGTTRAEAMIRWAQAQQKEKRETVVTNPAVKAKLYDGLFKTDESETTDVDILKAATANDLDPHDTSNFLRLRKALDEAPLKGPIYLGAMRGVKAELGNSPKGLENYTNFLETFIPEYIRKKKEGTLEPNALDLRNPESLISKTLDPFKLSPRDKMIARALRNLGGEMPEGGFGDTNLTGPGKGTISTTVHEVPEGMSLQDAVKKYGSGARIIIPSGVNKGKTWTVP